MKILTLAVCLSSLISCAHSPNNIQNRNPNSSPSNRNVVPLSIEEIVEFNLNKNELTIAYTPYIKLNKTGNVSRGVVKVYCDDERLYEKIIETATESLRKNLNNKKYGSSAFVFKQSEYSVYIEDSGKLSFTSDVFYSTPKEKTPGQYSKERAKFYSKKCSYSEIYP